MKIERLNNCTEVEKEMFIFFYYLNDSYYKEINFLQDMIMHKVNYFELDRIQVFKFKNYNRIIINVDSKLIYDFELVNNILSESQFQPFSYEYHDLEDKYEYFNNWFKAYKIKYLLEKELLHKVDIGNIKQPKKLKI